MTQTIGKFEILRTLGRGAMGEVFLGKDAAIGREVAIKTILPGLATAADLKQRFEREAKAAGTLAHPNIVTVFEYGDDQGTLFLAMEYVEGEDLHELLTRRELSPPEILEVVAQVCEGLHHAHKHGVIHRDVKPSNVMVKREDGQLVAKVMDFGVAKATTTEMTQTGQVVGTLAYMAPEYLRSGKAGPQSDLFSVGVMLFEALSGQKPFAGETTGAMVYNIIHDEARPLDVEDLEGVSPSVRLIVERALVKDPEKRFASGAEFAKALRAAKDPQWSSPDDDRTVALPRISARTAPVDRPRGARAPWVVAALAILAVLGGAGYLVFKERAKAHALAEAENAKLGDLVLDQASRNLEKDPAGTLAEIDKFIESVPEGGKVDPDAYALKLVIRYRQNDLIGFGSTLEAARDAKATGAELLKNGRFKAMLEKDQKTKRLPAELRAKLLKGEL
jgi:serine/threonine-protein kinase